MRFILIIFFISSTCFLSGQTRDRIMTGNKDTIKTENEWKRTLTSDQYQVMRQCGTEPPFTGKYYKHDEQGIYYCAACGAQLFRSDTKYDSGSGWPSFYEAIDKNAITEIPDDRYGMHRIEIKCAACGSHLGHVFPDGPNPTGLRYCVNSVSLDFKRRPEPKNE